MTLLPTPPSLPLIATAPSFSPNGLACSGSQSLPPLLPIPHHSKVSSSAFAFAYHTSALHEKIRDKIMKNNANYKASTDFHRRLKKFNVGDNVMIRLRPERFSLRAVKKLHAQSAGPFQIRKKINLNVCVVNLPPKFCINCTFNVEHFIPYRCTFYIHFNPFMDEPTRNLSSVNPHCLQFLLNYPIQQKT